MFHSDMKQSIQNTKLSATSTRAGAGGGVPAFLASSRRPSVLEGVNTRIYTSIITHHHGKMSIFILLLLICVPTMSRALFTQNEQVDKIRLTPPFSSNHNSPSLRILNWISLLFASTAQIYTLRLGNTYCPLPRRFIAYGCWAEVLSLPPTCVLFLREDTVRRAIIHSTIGSRRSKTDPEGIVT